MILQFFELETTNPLIFWAQRTVAFPKNPNRKISFQTVKEEELLYFNIIIFGELMT